MTRPKRRLILRLFALLVLLLLVLVIALPLWFPWMLRPIAGSLRLGYADYEREGLSRFRLTQLTMPAGSGTVHAEEVRAFLPTAWLWKIVWRQTNEPFLRINTWEFRAISGSAMPAKPSDSVYTNLASLDKTFAALRQWLPNAFLTNGDVRLGSNATVAIPGAQWLAGNLTAQVIPPKRQPVEIEIRNSGGAMSLRATAKEFGGGLDLTVTNTGETVRLLGKVLWLSNRFDLSVEFTRSGSFPKAASLRGDHFEIPGDAFNLAQYRSVAGSLRADLNLKPNADSGRNFTVNFVATAVPLTTGLPPIDVDVLASGATSPRWDLSVQPLRWRNGDRDLELAADVNWPERGNLRVAAHHLGSELLQDFFRTTNAPVVLNEFALEAGWTNGPVRFSANASASMKSKAGFEFAFAMRASGDDQGIRLNQLSVSSATQIVCRAEGFLPFALTPANSNGLVQVSSGGVLELRAFTETNSALWEELGKKLPIKLANPMVRIDVSGTWSKPQGRVLATVQRLEMRSASSFPVVSDLNFDVRMDREMANARLEVLVQEQPVHASARLPLGRGFWEGLGNRRRLPDLRNATGELVVSDAKLAAFVDFAPKILAPQGELNIDVKLERGNKLFGHAVVYNAATRPLAPLGPLRAIDGELSFSGTELSVSNISAEIGGQRVAASGRAQIADAFWRERKLPEFQLHVVGTNVPLVRQASAVVRADLDLAITNSPGTNAVVSGRVGLHDSFYLSSLKDLAPGKVASPKRRPPYFSIEEEPFAGWRLGVSVEGEKFLKVQSPFFVGTVSTMLRLEGTLREPQALGEVRINSGTVTFPFGNLDVQQGFVSLTSADPYRPHLFVNAGAQRMGYEIKMEATGPADQPVVQFSSTPPLSSEQIVLMLTTGQMPQGVAASSARQRAQGLAMFVGKNILSDLGFGGSGDGRLTIRSAEQLTETGRPTYDVEYRLNKDWSIVGEYDRYNQYNLGMKWKVYSK